MNKKGTTLIETVISIFLVSVVLLTFLEALHIGISGTLNLNRKTSALNLAKSQMESIKDVDYVHSSGDLDDIYTIITTEGNISDIVNYNISGTVTVLNEDQPLQQINIDVSYLVGKQVQIIGYKTDDGSLAVPAPKGVLVTDVVPNVPTMPQGYGGMCLGTFRGYYHVFTVGTEGPASVHWKFDWMETSGGIIDIGCPIMAVYNGTPPWTKTDAEGNVRQDALIVRNQNGLWLGDVAGIGDLPGPGNGNVMCRSCDDDYDDPNEENPLYYMPHHHSNFLIWLVCLFYSGVYPCCGYSQDGGEIFWSYDNSGSEGTAEDTLVTGDLEPGTYTVLFFNSENMKNLDTISASVSYYY